MPDCCKYIKGLVELVSTVVVSVFTSGLVEYSLGHVYPY